MLDDYQCLAAVIAATEGVDERQLQDLVFLLQTTGAPLNYRYQMHFDRPYSESLDADASLLDAAGFVDYVPDSSNKTVRLIPTDAARRCLERASEIQRYTEPIRELLAVEPSVLNSLATFAAWRTFKRDAKDALRNTLQNHQSRSVAEQTERFLSRLGLLA